MESRCPSDPAQGYTFKCKALTVSGSHTALQLDGTLLVDNDRDSWPGSADFITASHVTDLVFTTAGSGEINGQGQVWWQHRDDFRPRLMYLHDTANVLVERITLRDSPNHNIEAYSSSSEFSNVTILAPPSTGISNPSHNTDGIDVHGANMYIHDSFLSVGGLA